MQWTRPPLSFSISQKLKTPMEGKRFGTIEEIKEKSKQGRYQKALFRSVSRIGKNASISVLYLKGGYFEGDKIVIDK